MKTNTIQHSVLFQISGTFSVWEMGQPSSACTALTPPMMGVKRATGLGKRFPIFVKYCDVWYFECYPSICVTALDNVWLISACQDCQVKTFFSITKVPAAEMLCDAGLWWIMRPMRGAAPAPAPALLLTSHSSLRNFLYTRIFMLMRPKYCSLTI